MQPLDILVHSYIDIVRTSGLTEFMYMVSRFFDPAPFILISIFTTLFIYCIRGLKYASLFATAIACGSVMVWVLKVVLNVARPSLGVVEAFGKSFPSGHALVATIFFVLLIFIFDDYIKGFSRKFFNCACIFCIFIVSVSRIYLGVHWVSDVVGGIVLGAVFAYFYTEIFRMATKS